MVRTRSATRNPEREDQTASSAPIESASSEGELKLPHNHTLRNPKDKHILHPANLPHGPKSLSGIAGRAFGLGLSLGSSILLTTYLLHHNNPLWRLPFFLAVLSLFHFLEFWTTATYNTKYADTSAFLLSTNGTAYNVAHCAAFLETFISAYLFQNWRYRAAVTDTRVIAAGVALVILGQAVRSIAMAQAATNFNHTVQVEKNKGHELVKHGVYGWLRHPSYFGFFWWSVGSQIALGNVVCVVGYAVSLWIFFRHRIQKEEELLVRFFGNEYVVYRKSTSVGIPFL